MSLNALFNEQKFEAANQLLNSLCLHDSKFDQKMKLAKFSAKCKQITCGHEFDAPLLSDFSYGEFIYGSINGEEIRYYNSLNCDSWKFIDKIVSASFDNMKREKIGAIIQKVIGLVADRPHPDIYFTQDIYCPKCHSKVTAINDNDKTGSKEYEQLTFHNFIQLTELEKKHLIERLITV